ncbi:16S rRNA (cytosine(1402)-N(4))-methyltransferase RsmH [Tessaracoccus palaemonis]|uniref:Ribosomal RNA small subunit methyltransferase H n=1 Tax=Tessaracoccus palaemonis TaxID=2829499 RepID=A0ABX8SJ60_9ACTN|nr:16S rRNA (cytosine(1402)-N(4))-methyltransferase RsmH [Tessaracoccus palaemonis]QXT62023.1 16S rRNA (cytosine(1402)-N(4))-methyltransferase RsmH [Tessaracoccus palaemonis]
MTGFTDVHDPVMIDRIVELLSPALQRPGAVYVDGTLGLAGHASAILAANPEARLVGIDRDPDAHEVARERLGALADRATLVQAVYDELPDVLTDLGIGSVDAILLDLGLSSLQIDRTERGFAYRVDAPLDMRMNPTQGPTAADVLNTYSAGELARILKWYGEERFADRIARAVVAARQDAPFERSGRLVDVISSAIPAAARHTGGHPAKRTFQALRIEVNRELAALEGVLPAAVAALAVGGRFAVLSYHSLEDRLVKRTFAAGAADRAPRDLPVVPENLRAELRLLTRGAERPGAEETATNPRAASARLRVAERIREAS